jgi:RNA recognition motif-containing protein
MQICKPYGSVKHLVYLFHTQGAQTGQPKGYCFVEYSSRQEADNARRSLNGKIALGRQLKVNWAQPASADSQLKTPLKETEVKQLDRKQALEKIKEIEAKLQSMNDKSSLESNSSVTDDKTDRQGQKCRYKPYCRQIADKS